ncbi:Long-chain-fatty-acid--CoA ligase [Pigmentiphaga humi]|uniref:Long-chain-fatty-acid--CoA ligase n=1 Tax=Pigmentiphaga humi TaxID=2478468 RepID=A0A3P4B5T7_9BURK|nr:class I adenylate-forming enzyme family protein [Pigmentiphaga humi]VCU71028.1 Long-chain-fatty-acid--CoA ligase [Pigmentiphaga humi]
MSQNVHDILARQAQQPFVDFPSIIARHAGERPDAPAFACGGDTLSWSELARQADRVAAACAAMGVAPGGKVALLAAPGLRAVQAFFGTVRAGGCVVPLATSATAATLLGMLGDSDAKVLVADADARETLEGVEAELAAMFPQRLVALDFHAPGWLDWDAWLAQGGAPPAVEFRPDQPFNLIYSSGTTGKPKGILHLHGMRSRQANRRSFGLGPESAMLLSTPLYSNTTLQPMLATAANGGLTVLMRKFDAAGYLRLCQEHRVTHTMLVPVQYQRLLAHEDFARTDLSSFVLKQCTGAPLDARLKSLILEKWPGGLREVYGMTEGGCSCVLDAHEFPDKLGTVGRPAPDHDMRIVDEDGRVLAQGEVGEIVGWSPYMMAGYYKQPQATEAFYWRDESGIAFHRSGDIGRFDEDGFLILLDRKKDLIISGGFNIYATDLEAVTAAHPDVADVAVIGIPSEQWGETPLALVVLQPGRALDAEALRAWVNGQVGRTQRLAAVEYRNELPRSALGKLLKRELRQPYWK